MFDYFKNFVKHSMTYSVGNMIYRAAAFLLIPLYTRTLVPADYGSLEMFYVVASVMRTFLGIMIGHATIRFYFEFTEEIEKKRVISTSLLISAAISSLVILSVWNFTPQLSRLIFKTTQYQNVFYIVFFIVFFELSREIGLSYLRVKERSLLYIIIAIVQLIIQVVLNLWFVLSLHMGIEGILWASLVSIIITWIILIFITIRFCGFNFDFHKVKLLAHYCSPFLLATVTGVIINNADRIMLNNYRDLTVVGIYALALKFGLLIKDLVIEPFNRNFGQSRFAIMKNHDAKRIYARTLIYFAYVMTFLCLGISFFSKEALHVFVGSEFWNAYKPVPFILFAVTIGGMSYIFETGILIQKKTKYIFMISFFSAIVVVVCNRILIPALSSYGAAIAMLLTSVFTCILTYAISNKIYPLQHEFSRLFKIFAVGIVLAVTTFVSEALLHLKWYIAIVFKALMLLSFPVLLHLLSFYKEEEKTKLKLFLVLIRQRFVHKAVLSQP
ncbi:MAG: polysaccharide biosynthesis C-terminal domain-containing protein [Candidatus Omnitrophota bacterium]